MDNKESPVIDASLKLLDWESCECCQRCVGSPNIRIAVSVRPRIFKWQWMLKIDRKERPPIPWNVLHEVIFTHHVSSSFWIIGCLAWEHGANQQKTRCQLTRTENALRWQNVPVQISLIQVQLWFKFLLESPAIVTTCRATTNRRSWKVSYFKLNLFNSRRFVEVEI